MESVVLIVKRGAYAGKSALVKQGVLLVNGSGNSGMEIAHDLATATHGATTTIYISQ